MSTEPVKVPDTVTLEWKGKEYELRYTFKMVRRLRDEGLNFPGLMRDLFGKDADPMAPADRGDDIALVVAWLLKNAGCADVTDEEIYRYCLADREFRQNAFGLLIWAYHHHTKQSENVPKPAAQKLNTPMTSS